MKNNNTANAHERFSEKLSRIAGVKGYILVRDDGQVLASRTRTEKAEKIGAMIVIIGSKSRTFQNVMGLSSLNYIVLTRRQEERLYVFEINNYYLGIWQDSDQNSSQFVTQIQNFIREILRRNRLSKKVEH